MGLTALLMMGMLVAVGPVTADEQDAVRDPVRGTTVLEAPEGVYTLTAVCEVLLVDDTVVPAGDPLFVGDVIEVGLARNDGDTTIIFVTANGDEVELPPGGVLQTECVHSCSVGPCRVGRHACCWWTVNNCARCTCVQDGKLPYPGIGCNSGGTGAMSCSMAAGGAKTIEPMDDEPWTK